MLVQALALLVEVVVGLKAFVVLDDLVFRIGKIAAQPVAELADAVGDVQAQLHTAVLHHSLTELRNTDTNDTRDHGASADEDVRPFFVEIGCSDVDPVQKAQLHPGVELLRLLGQQRLNSQITLL